MTPFEQFRISVSASPAVCIVLCYDGIQILVQVAVLLCLLCLKGGEFVIHCHNVRFSH